MRILTRHIKPVQSLADISRSAQCYHSNKTRAPIANPPNCARLEGTSLPFPQLTSGSVKQCGRQTRDIQTHRHTDGRDYYTFSLT